MRTFRGTLVAFDLATFTATIRFDASAAQSATGLPVSRALPSAEMVPGRRVLVAASDSNDPGEMVVIAVS